MNLVKLIKNLLWIDDQLTVGQKLTIGSIVLSALVLAVGTAGLYSLAKIENYLITEQVAAGEHIGSGLIDRLSGYKKFLAFLTFAGVFTSLLFGYRIRRRISKPLEELSHKSREIGSGDVSTLLEVSGEDEISRVASSFNEMIKSTRKLINSIKEVSTEVENAAHQVAATSQEMTSTTEQISTTIQSIASGAIEEKGHLETSVSELQMMAGIGDAISNTCNVAREESSTTNDLAASCGETASKAVDRLDMAKKVVDDSADVIYNLGEQTKEIEQILDVINSIAEQTNLLALNAAIEAARAGEHGRGFAVVAEEVRKLAEGSAKATDKIAGLLGGIKKESEKAVNVMKGGTKELSDATKVVRESMSSLKEIEEAVSHLNERVGSITEATEELSKSVDTVMSAMDETMVVVEKAAAGTEETAASTEEQSASMEELSASAQELANLVEKLNHAVSQFKTGGMEGEIVEEGERPIDLGLTHQVEKPLPAMTNGGRKK